MTRRPTPGPALRPALGRPVARRATIADVARLAGVAKGSVSNYLNGQVRLSDDLRRRIAEAISALDYRPADIGRSLTSRRRGAFDVSKIAPGMPLLTVVGHVSVDFMVRLDRLPDPQGRQVAQEISKAIGGPAANVAALAAGLGGGWPVATSLLTAIGNDVDSDWARAELAARRVEVIASSGAADGRLARAMVMVEPGGQRTIVAEPVQVAEIDLGEFIASHAPGPRRWCLHFEGFQVAARLAQVHAARRAGFLTSTHTTGMDSAWFRAHVDELLTLFDLVVVQRETLDGARPDAAMSWLSEALSRQEAPAARVVVSLGRDGAACLGPSGETARCPARRDSAIDETGANDAIVGTLLGLWLHGAAIEEALPFAVASADRVATRLGSQELRPTAAELGVDDLLVPADTLPDPAPMPPPPA
ncbi:carbohydrate kinase family protein [Acidimangrovimonas sediminis]|uniref:carbohydrate kinase family protein n=1 Tax=Acidimangrovimonas sediminis TaxID=2056283 RepID=UPI000C7FB6B5|nr:PfkB family carbohydrate kinase [Acidimangrovimonas sediminis]